jgi:hypothetical protein
MNRDDITNGSRERSLSGFYIITGTAMVFAPVLLFTLPLLIYLFLWYVEMMCPKSRHYALTYRNCSKGALLLEDRVIER